MDGASRSVVVGPSDLAVERKGEHEVRPYIGLGSAKLPFSGTWRLSGLTHRALTRCAT